MRSGLKTYDLTVGKPSRVLFTYMLPMLVSMFFQQAYNLADSWIAGNFIGENALGAVGTCYPLTVCLLAVSTGLSVGISIFTAREFGAKNTDAVLSAAFSALRVYVPLSFAVIAAGLAAAPWVVNALYVPESMQPETVLYIRVYISGFLFEFLYNIFTAVLNGLGNSRTPLLILLMTCVVNIILDVVCVTVLPMGVAGLALATVLSQAVSCVVTGIAAVKTLRGLNCGREARRFSGKIMKELFRLGVPSMLNSLLISFGQMNVQGVINAYGEIALAGYSAAFRLNGLYTNSMMAVSNALTGYISQNYGAKRPDRMQSGIRIVGIICTAFTVLTIAVYLLCGRAIIGSFLTESADKAEIVETGMGFVTVVAPSYLILFYKFVMDGYIRGLGRMREFLADSIIDAVVRIGFAASFSRHFGLFGLWFLWPFAWVIDVSLDVYFYVRIRREARKTVPDAVRNA